MKSFSRFINEADENKPKTKAEKEIEAIDQQIEYLKKQNEREKSADRDIKIIKLNQKKKELAIEKQKEKLNEGADIINLYKKAKLKVPQGKGVHTKEFHSLAIKIAQGYIKSGMSQDKAFDLAYPTAMKQLGRDKSVKKGHQR